MQLVSRYLVSNRVVVVLDDFVGNPVEYRKVYQRNITVARGIDNTITFEVKNSDHKPVSILNTYVPYVEVYTEDDVLLKTYTGTIKETATPNYKGQFTITITNSDTLNLDGQYLKYTVYLIKSSDQSQSLTYADSQFGIQGTIDLTGSAFPGPYESKVVDTFVNYTSEVVDAQPHINSNEGLHTAVFYTTGYEGDLVIEGTLDANNTTSWFEIDSFSVVNPTQPVYKNFNGVFSNLRFKYTPASGNNGTIDKILVRN
jgi:hypothetical protein